jgi:hypothetical protein
MLRTVRQGCPEYPAARGHPAALSMKLRTLSCQVAHTRVIVVLRERRMCPSPPTEAPEGRRVRPAPGELQTECNLPPSGSPRRQGRNYCCKWTHQNYRNHQRTRTTRTYYPYQGATSGPTAPIKREYRPPDPRVGKLWAGAESGPIFVGETGPLAFASDLRGPGAAWGCSWSRDTGPALSTGASTARADRSPLSQPHPSNPP